MAQSNTTSATGSKPAPQTAYIPGQTTRKGKPIFSYMKYKWWFIAVSLFFALMSCYEIFVGGINLGIDFVGGAKLAYEFDRSVGIEAVRASLDKLNIGEVQVIPFENPERKNQMLIRAKNLPDQDVTRLVDSAINQTFADKAILLSQEMVGPKVGQDLQRKALLSITITCILILIYTGFRFDFLFAPGAIVALVHDVLISLGFFVYFGKEFTLPILAALLTILGYSVNDTIVVYDRIRENINHLPKSLSTSRIVDISLTETLSRTIVTNLTVLLVVLVLFYLGGGVLHDFAFVLIIGMIFGTYSSIFIASPLYVWLQRLFPHRGIKKD